MVIITIFKLKSYEEVFGRNGRNYGSGIDGLRHSR